MLYNLLGATNVFRHSLKLVPFFTGAYVAKSRFAIHNDTAQPLQIRQLETPKVDNPVRKLNYEDLCFGSISGLVLGVAVGRYSSLLVFLTLSAYLLLQFLENRGFIRIPWNSIVDIGQKRIDLHALFFRRPSFKVTFAASFLIAAFNV